MFGHGLHFDRVTEVRLVRTIFADRRVIGNARPVLGHALALGKLLKDGCDDRGHGVPDVFLGHEAHFQVELVELARQTIGARVFVAEAWRDLEVAVKAGNHQQLLVLLRCLRQRKELAGVDTAGHEEVARAFRRRGRQDRRRVFGEAGFGHATAHGRNHLRAAHDIGVQLLATQVQEAVTQAHVFRIFLIAEHRQRQFLGSRQHFDLADKHFNRASGQVRIDRRRVTQLHLAIDADHPFRAHLFGSGESGRIRVDDGLRHPIMVAQVDKQQAAMVADAMHPAAQAHGLAGFLGSEGPAGMRAVAM
ncbi:hypothetical protein D9M68_706850 [compost metagenome]